MEEGSLRCDANISVRIKGQDAFGTKVEVKNMNSIRNVQRAIEFEITRQIEVLESGGKLSQETRGFDALKGITISMRSKEAANDYRYFPEPDLQPLFIKQEQIDEIKKDMPTLPRALFEKYTKEFGLSEYDAYNLTDNKGIALYYEELIRHTKNYKVAANWIMGDIKSYLNEFGKEIDEFPLNAERIASLIKLIDEGKISSSIASQKIFPEMLKSEEPALLIAERLNLIQDSSEDTLKNFILKVFEENKAEVERYKEGEKQLTGFFMGKLMQISNGKADPKIANSLLRQMLEQ
jgi:aspartyl-tRNA(Asn)/glutamyl-tRNA(Gln) amidotransferase subunit B